MMSGLKFTPDSFDGAVDSWQAGIKECGEYVGHGDYTFEAKDDELTVSVPAQFKDRDATIEFVFDKDLYLESMTVSAKFSLGEIMEKAGLNTCLLYTSSGSAAGAEDRNVSGSVTSAETGDGFGDNNSGDNGDGNEDMASSQAFFEKIQSLKKGMTLPIQGMEIKEGKTSPPKRYNSGSLILAMENAGQLIEDEELRAQIKGSGIGTKMCIRDRL